MRIVNILRGRNGRLRAAIVGVCAVQMLLSASHAAAHHPSSGTRGGSSFEPYPAETVNPPPSVTQAPEVQACTATGQRSLSNPENAVVTFSFDEDVTGQPAVAHRFHIYRVDGLNVNAVVVRASASQVFAEFLPEHVRNARVCTVDFDAVNDASGRANPEGDAPMQTALADADSTNGADLLSVENLREDTSGFYADYVFDEKVSNRAGGTIPDASRFELITHDGTVFRGRRLFAAGDPPGVTPIVTTTPDQSAITVWFSEAPRGELGALARAVVEENTVCDADGVCSALQAVEVTHKGHISDGNTTTPDLVSARAVSSKSVDFRFDGPLSGDAPIASAFGIYDAYGNWDTADEARFVHRAYGSDGLVVVATFLNRTPTLPGRANVAVDDAVGAFVFGVDEDAIGKLAAQDCAVRSQPDHRCNRDDEVRLAPWSPVPAGRTALPDLVSVQTHTDPVTQRRVVRYTFDSSVAHLFPSGPNQFSCADFRLYDESGVQFVVAPVGAACTVGDAGTAAGSESDIRSVSGDADSVDVFSFGNATADGAVLGIVNDSTNEVDGVNVNSTAPRFPEGGESVVRA